MFFEWDSDKEGQNRKKHGISFREAATVFGDPLSTTYPDVAHSQEEQRCITIGMTEKGKIVVVAHREEEDTVRIINARGAPAVSGGFMRKGVRKKADELLPEYDFASMPGGVRGKYVLRYRRGTNLALLDRDVAEAFPDDRAVNETLRAVLKAAEKLTGRPPRKQRKQMVAR